MEDRAKKEDVLRGEIARSILMKEEDKMFWLEQANTLPAALLDKVVEALKEHNSRVDEYLDAALKEDKDHKYLAELKDKIMKIKAAAFAMDEKGEKSGAEENLKKELENL